MRRNTHQLQRTRHYHRIRNSSLNHYHYRYNNHSSSNQIVSMMQTRKSIAAILYTFSIFHILLFSNHVHTVTCTVTIPFDLDDAGGYDEDLSQSFRTLQADFGKKLLNGERVYAHLAVLEDNLTLCGDMDNEEEAGMLRGISEDNKRQTGKTSRSIVIGTEEEILNGETKGSNQKSGLFWRHPFLKMMGNIDQNSAIDAYSSSSKATVHSSKANGRISMNAVVTPNDGKPVALLVKRGQCTFESKARMIMSNFYPTVKYMIVYDNLIESENRTDNKGENVSDDSYISVTPMNAVDPTGIELGLFSISNESGNVLLNTIQSQRKKDAKNGGLFIILSSQNSWDAPYLFSRPVNSPDALRQVLQIIATMFFLFSVFGCIILCCSGDVTIDGNVITIGRREGVDEDTRPIPSPLLTVERVLNFPEIEYWTDDGDMEIGALSSVGSNDERKKSSATNEPSINESLLSSVDSSSVSKDGQSTSSQTRIPIPRETHSQLSNNSRCVICLEEFVAGEKLRLLPCNHIFHTTCIVPWLTERFPTCPLCKEDLNEEPAEGESVAVEADSDPNSMVQYIIDQQYSIAEQETVVEDDDSRGNGGFAQLFMELFRSEENDVRNSVPTNTLRTALLQDPRSPPGTQTPTEQS